VNFDLRLANQVLARTPATLDALLRDQPDAWTQPNEGPETFSAFDVIGHLIDGEETDWMPRTKIILAQGPDPRFEPYDRFRHRARNKERTLNSLLDEFARLRATNLETLLGWDLLAEQLELRGQHPRLGAVTLRELLGAWVVHDLGHIAQVVRVMAKQYRDVAGPWIAFLPVLTDHETPRS